MNFDFVVIYYFVCFFYGLSYSLKMGKSSLFIAISMLFEMPVAGRLLEIW